jgi:hypothetical protein
MAKAPVTSATGRPRREPTPQVLSIKRKVLAAVATLTIAGGVSAAVTGGASAATPECGQSLHLGFQQ